MSGSASPAGTGGSDVSDLHVHDLMDREWLCANSLGGYASSSLVALNTRKYHGLLVAAMAPPVRRMVILSRVEDLVTARGRTDALACAEYPGVIHPCGYKRLRAFSHTPYPRWAYQGDGWTIEKSVRVLRGENTVVLTWTLLTADQPVELEARPLLALRGMHELTYQWSGRPSAEAISGDEHQLRVPPTPRTPETFLAHDGAFRSQPDWYLSTIYRREVERGYAGTEDLWMPGPLRWTLSAGQSAHLVCSTDPIDLVRAIEKANQLCTMMSPARRRNARSDASSAGLPALPPEDPTLDALLAAADQFVVSDGQGAAQIIPSYPWSPPQARDSLISFTGLLMVPRRFAEARSLLERLASTLHRGLIASEFPEDGSSPLYLSADASLWWINALYAYWRYTADHATVQSLFEHVVQIIRAYRAGTWLGINVDREGLVSSRAVGMGTTWMNAKVGDWLITPRAGRPVELTALWYNALRIAAEMSERFDGGAHAAEFNQLADLTRESFNARFWNPDAGCLHDVLLDSGLPDSSIRPNQLLAISLPHAVLAPQRFALTMDTLRRHLLTVGVRTLSPDDPSYRGRYHGDVVSRDRAYHQGSAYPWLLGPYVTALLRTDGRDEFTLRRAREAIAGCLAHSRGSGLGQICELFDGDDAPHKCGGAIASARSVAEILRCYAEDLLGIVPPRLPHTEKTPQFSS